MEHKTWLWRRKTSEKTISAGNKSDLAFTGDEEKQENAFELEKSLQDLKEQLSSARTKSVAKDELLAKQTKVAEEAIAGWKKAEAEAESFKQDLDHVRLEKAASEERIANLDAALKECMQQLHVSKEEQQHIIHDAVTKISAEQEKARSLEKRLGETNIKLGKVVADNSSLGRILEVKEKLIEDLSNSQSQSEADFTAIVARLDSSEKDNDSLKYEVCMLQKELEIRSQDRDFHLKSADASHRQYLESVKKIARLESECQRLRVMVRKRLPGPAAIAKMRNEVDMLGSEPRRNKTRYAAENVMSRDFELENDYDQSSKRVSSLVERLQAIEDENNILKEALVKRNGELQSSRTMFARTVSKLSQAEVQLEELSKGQALRSISEDGGNEDTASCAESWASALISELEHFRNGKAMGTPNRTDISELSLMDDFVEMEKLAIVCVDKPSRKSNADSGADSKLGEESTGKEMVPVDLLSDFNETDHENQSSFVSLDNHPPWLKDILRVIVEKHQSTNKSLDVIIEEVCVALGKNEASKKFYQPNCGKPLLRLIELIEGIIRISTSNRCQQILARNDGSNSQEYKSASPTAHVARVFLWEISELSSVLQRFLVVCNDLLHRKTDFEKFASELASIVDWIINHCFSLRDVSSMKEGIKDLFGDNGFESGIAEVKSDELGSSSPLSITSNGLHIFSRKEEALIKDENIKLRNEIKKMESTKKDLEERLKSARIDNESLITRLKEAGDNISNLRAELAAGNDFKELIEDQIVNQKLITEDLNTQLTVAKAELNVAQHKFSSLEVELDDKRNCCEELESTCLDLQLQLQSATAEETPKIDKDQAEKQLRADWEISAASEKLAECQATILNLGKQLKAMAAPENAGLIDKVISSSTAARTNHNPRLLDQLQAEDESRSEHLASPKTKEIICTEAKPPPDNPNAGLLYGRKLQTSAGSRESINQPSMVKLPDFFYKTYEPNHQKVEADVGKLVLVPERQKGGASFLRKLLSKRRKDSGKKLALTIGS